MSLDRLARVAAVVGLALVVSGCGTQIPADPEGTLERVTGGVLRAGITSHADRVIVDSSEDDPSGVDVELIEEFAETLDAEVEWTVDSEEALTRDLEAGTLDLIAGGITDKTPWIDRAGATRPYVEETASDGSKVKYVMLVPMGENAFLTELERYLTENGR